MNSYSQHFDYLNLFQHLGICQDLGLFSKEHEQKILQHYEIVIGTPKQDKWKIRYAIKIRNFLLRQGYLSIKECVQIRSLLQGILTKES
jgi:hypothetical protein